VAGFASARTPVAGPGSPVTDDRRTSAAPARLENLPGEGQTARRKRRRRAEDQRGPPHPRWRSLVDAVRRGASHLPRQDEARAGNSPTSPRRFESKPEAPPYTWSKPHDRNTRPNWLRLSAKSGVSAPITATPMCRRPEDRPRDHAQPSAAASGPVRHQRRTQHCSLPKGKICGRRLTHTGISDASALVQLRGIQPGEWHVATRITLNSTRPRGRSVVATCA